MTGQYKRFGDIPLGQFPVEADDDNGRPLPVKTIPRPSVSERGTKVIA
jgi:hypothetical protein